jgi:hypothetical protein
VEAEKLVWGCDNDIARIVDVRHQQQQHQQQQILSRRQFDLIIGSDLLYNPDAYAGAITSICQFSFSPLLSSPP